MLINQPQFTCELPFQVSTGHIIDVFVDSIQKQQNAYLISEFHVLDRDQLQVLAAKEHVAAVKNIVRRLVCLSENPYEQICLIQLTMEVNQIKCVRVVNVKGITGSASVNDDLIQTFRKSIERLYTKQDHAINDASEFSRIISDEQQTFQNPYYLESTAYYMFHKLLCAENYGLGKQVRDFIDRITAQLQDDSLVTLRQSMASINTFINSIVETLFQSFNFGKQETIEIMPYCRISIEKYFFLKVYALIKPRYQKLFTEQNAKFRERTTTDALSKLNLSAMDNMQELRINEATAELNRIQISQFPREKLKGVQMAIGILKSINPSLLLNYLKYAFLISDLEEPFSEIQFLFDCCDQSERGHINIAQSCLDWIIQEM